MEEFYNHSGIDDQELQLLSENVKTLSTQVASMERSINNPDFVRKILDQQKEAVRNRAAVKGYGDQGQNPQQQNDQAVS